MAQTISGAINSPLSFRAKSRNLCRVTADRSFYAALPGTKLSWLRISKALKGEIVAAFLPAFCPNGNRERLPYKTVRRWLTAFARDKKNLKKDLRAH